ncbi:type II toxin-antitoxin system PemK/MazF family toxin [Candidatus Uhrbacteria bacterium]|nr:type II toxin-antitoxin system PemK/MazF family toxin [Candidatus Uhrbacteria bacterium]
MRQGEIYLVNFEPSIGHECRKVRPALVIQSDEIFDTSSLVTVMPISSKIQTWQEPDVFIGKDSKNRLASDSVIRVRQISSFDSVRFIKRVGEANSPVLRKVRGYLRKHFAL